MLNQESITSQAAAYKKDAKKRFDAALVALLALAWEWKDLVGDKFSFDADQELYNEALRICRELSDGCADDAHDRLFALVEDSMVYDDGDWDEDEIVERLDMAGIHLLELLAVWVGVAIVNDWSQGYLRVMISRYLSNPFLCPEWKNLPLDVISWGRGYSRDIFGQITIIGQDAIIGGGRRIEWDDAVAKGATYYIRHRGSTYDCPDCDSLCGYPIPITEPFEWLHSRCCCWAEYFFEPL